VRDSESKGVDRRDECETVSESLTRGFKGIRRKHRKERGA